MKIAVNTRFLLTGKLEGIGIYTREIFKRVVQQMPEHEFIFLFDRPFSDEFIFADNISPRVLAPPARHPFLWYWWFEHSVPKALKQSKADLFISPDGFCSLNTNVPQVLTIHDLGFEHFPEHTPLFVRKYYRHFTPAYCKKADRILAVSEYTKNDICATYGIAPEKIDVVCNGFEADTQIPVRQLTDIDERLQDNRPYFIFVGAVHPRKNVEGLLKAYEQFRDTFSHGHQLVIVGRNAWMHDAVEQLYRQMKYRSDIIRIEYIERNDLLQVLRQAYGMVYPSFFEGFGIPVLEAMASGVPVIASNASSLPEVAGNAAILVNPNSTIEIAEAMHELIINDVLRNDLIARGKIQARLFDWNKSAQEVVEIIQSYQK